MLIKKLKNLKKASHLPCQCAQHPFHVHAFEQASGRGSAIYMQRDTGWHCVYMLFVKEGIPQRTHTIVHLCCGHYVWHDLILHKQYLYTHTLACDTAGQNWWSVCCKGVPLGESLGKNPGSTTIHCAYALYAVDISYGIILYCILYSYLHNTIRWHGWSQLNF